MSGVGPETRIPNNFPGDSDASDPQTTPWHCSGSLLAVEDTLIGLLLQTQKEKCPRQLHGPLGRAEAALLGENLTLHHLLFFGRGRFGQVHKCEEKATGLKLAAKIIKTRGVKDKVKAVWYGFLLAVIFSALNASLSSQDEVKNEINVMNQLDHVNLIQLYDAFESNNDIVLVME